MSTVAERARGERHAATFEIARAPYTFVFPRDHAAHPNYRTEWWYYTGHVRAPGGRRFGYELTFFRVGMRPGDPRPRPGQSRWRGNQLYPAHFAVTDVRGKTFFYAARFAREALGMGSASATDLDVNSGSWTLRGTPLSPAAAASRPNDAAERRAMRPNEAADRRTFGHSVSTRGRRETDPIEIMRLHATQRTPQGMDAIDFVLVPQKPPAIHGRGGVSRKDACASCASHYYSYTRLQTTGTLTFDGRKLPIAGVSWMDHEYGSGELESDQAGWDWFSLQLNGDRELMLYRLRQKDGGVTPQSSGSLIQPNGSVRYLPLAAFSTSATGTWHSPHTGATYPSGWRVRVPSAHLNLTLTPVLRDQELAATTGGISYWEGAVDVRDAATGAPRGVGYVELTGYAGAVAL